MSQTLDQITQLVPPSSETQKLIALFNAGRFRDVEILARSLVDLHPNFGFGWKALGAAIDIQGGDALSILQRALELLPTDPAAHNNLGNALRKLGKLEEAVRCHLRALELKPDYPEAHNNLGNALKELGQLDEAVRCYRRALELKPDYAEVHSNLGNALSGLGQPNEALGCYRRALDLKPDFAEAHSNFGNALLALGQLDEALGCYRRALELKPNYAEAHNNLGSALKDLGQLNEAIRCHRRALELRPNYAEAHNNLGVALSVHGLLDEARLCYQRALELKSDYAEAQLNLGNAMWVLGQQDEALRCYRRSLELKPDFPDAHMSLGTALFERGQPNEALRCFRRALELKPGYPEAYNNLGGAHKELGQLDEALRHFRRALELKAYYPVAHSNLLFTMNCLQSQPAIVLKEEARRYGDLVTQESKPFSDWPVATCPDPSRHLNVGLVSGDLRTHPVGFVLESVVVALARNRMTLFVYQTHARTDRITEFLKGHMLHWIPVMGITDEKLAEQIRRDDIDILIDLSGHTAHNRLPVFAWKPAPIQVTWLGYFATTGVPGMDYILVDPWSVPFAEEDQFTEQVWRLPETRLCFTPPEGAGDVGPLPALASGQVTFGCFSNLAKVNDAVLVAWARVLEAVPRARLFLKANQLNDAIVRENLRARFAHQGIAGSRLIFESSSSRVDYFAAYHRVDIVLDTFPYPGGATTMEALWMGVPVLTLKGDRLLSRQGESLLMNAGLQDWIATDANNYVSRAVRKVADLEALAQLRAILRKQVQASPLFDSLRFAKHFEAELRAMWQKWCDQHALREKDS